MDRTWASAANGSWNTAANWNPAGVPTAADDLTIPFAVTVSINNGGNGLANSLTITSGVTINRGGGRLMTVTGGITVTPGGNVTNQRSLHRRQPDEDRQRHPDAERSRTERSWPGGQWSGQRDRRNPVC